MLRQVLKDKQKEVSDAKDRLRQVKEDAIREYRDFDALLAELEGFFADGFDDCLRKVKASFPNLDLSHVSIDAQAQAQTPAQPVHSESTDELFADNALIDDTRGDRETALVKSQIKPVEGSTSHPDEVQVIEGKDEDTPPVQQQVFFFFWIKCKVFEEQLMFNLTLAFCTQTSPFVGFRNILIACFKLSVYFYSYR